MAEIVTTIFGFLNVPAIIKQYVIDPLKVQFRYLCCTESILDSLRTKAENLERIANNLQSDVNVAEQKLEMIRTEVKDWLESAAKIKEETDRFSQNIPDVQEGCINGICRYSVSRDAMKMAKAIDALGDGKFERVADPPPPPGSKYIPVLPGTDLKSRKTEEDEIMAALRDNSVYMIGICGMGGVGKTTMAEKIWKRAKEDEKLFGMVAKAVVSQQLDKKGIQKRIAEYLGLKLEEDDISIRAGHLRTRLMKEKSILIIIDDIWKGLNLTELGIPSQGDHKGCKIILTFRDRDVCTDMEATKTFSLEGLGEIEAWALFKANANTCVDDHALHQIARDVAKECKGLPLALVTVGRALRDENNVKVWENALGELQKSAPSNISGVVENVYKPLKLSYSHLESDEARYLFLLCCLFPEDSRISLQCLLHYGVGLRIFYNVETLRQARNRVDALVKMLESRNLLMDDSTEEGIKCVKMHDVIRDVAIYIASKGEHVFMTSHGLKDWPKKDSYENYTCISLTLRDNATLPECINCPILKMLSIQSLWDVRVPDTSFDRMRELNVLNIRGIGSLPSSLQSLTNLRTLRLCRGEIKDVAMIGQLVKLEILDLSYSKLQVLPKEIGGLENLKSLDLRQCLDLRQIAPGVISSLVQLEELFVIHGFKNWEAEVEGEERRNASLVEVTSLKRLTALQLHIPNPKVLPLHWLELGRSVIWIRREPPYDEREEDYEDNNIILHLNEITPLVVHAMIRKADRLDLNLSEMDACDELIKSIQVRNEYLKSLKLCRCGNMKYLANKLSLENNVFPKLRSLFISNCRDLEGISSVRPSLAGSFDSLEVLMLGDLCKLTHFWNQKLCLSNLRKVNIWSCSSLQCIFLQSTAESAHVVDHMVFPNLKELILSKLPSFICFWKADNGIESSHKLDGQCLFNQKVTFPSLEQLQLFEIETATQIFSSQIPIDSFSWLDQLIIDYCPNLKVIFSPHILRNFRTLHELVVSNCSKLEEVVGKEDDELQAVDPLFPELENLKLSKLPNFKTFCHMENDIELPQLKSITIEECHKMETFSVGSLSLPHLAYVFGLLKPDLATRILFKKETPRHEIHFDANSFTLSAEDLSRFEKYGSQLCLTKDSSNNFIVARLLNFGRSKIGGRFEMVKLSPETLYEVVFEIKLEGSRFHCKGPKKLGLAQSEGKTQERLGDLEHLPREEWIEILAGKFTTGPDPFGNLEFSLSNDLIGGLLIKGVIIRPEP